MNRKQRKKRESQNRHQPKAAQVSKAVGHDVEQTISEGTISDSSDKLDSREIPVILLLAFLGVVPIGVILLTNTQPLDVYVLNPEKRSGIFSYASFWLSAAAALAAGRGVLRSNATDASIFRDSDYYWEGAIFIFAAAVCAALAVSDHPNTPVLLFGLLACLCVAQVAISGMAVCRLRRHGAKWRRALILRVISIVVLSLAIGGYGYLVFGLVPEFANQVGPNSLRLVASTT